MGNLELGVGVWRLAWGLVFCWALGGGEPWSVLGGARARFVGGGLPLVLWTRW